MGTASIVDFLNRTITVCAMLVLLPGIGPGVW